MDNFMDKIAKRFNAGELIQANGEAEARENQRLKEQLGEYDKILQEIRRLNFKTIEVSEQVSQMAACSIEQIEAFQVPMVSEAEQESYADDFVALKDGLSALKENLAAMEQRLVQACAPADDEDSFISLSRKVDESAVATQRKLEDVMYRLEASISQAESAISQLQASVGRIELGNDTNQKVVEGAFHNFEQLFDEKFSAKQEDDSARQIKEMIVNVRLYLDEVQKHIEDYVHKEDVKVYRNVQAAVNEQLSVKTRDLNDHMDQIEKEVHKNKGLKGLVLIAILLSGASLVMQVLQFLGIL